MCVCVVHPSLGNHSAGFRLPINYCSLVNLIIFLSADLRRYSHHSPYAFLYILSFPLSPRSNPPHPSILLSLILSFIRRRVRILHLSSANSLRYCPAAQASPSPCTALLLSSHSDCLMCLGFFFFSFLVRLALCLPFFLSPYQLSSLHHLISGSSTPVFSIHQLFQSLLPS